MLIDIIPLPLRYPKNVTLDTTGCWFNYHNYCDEIFSEGRPITINSDIVLYKYKIIESINNNIIERIVVTLHPLELSKLSTQGDRIEIYQLSIKTFNLEKFKIDNFYRFVQDTTYIADLLNHERSNQFSTTSSVYLWYMGEIAAQQRQENVYQELVEFYKPRATVIEGLVNNFGEFRDNRHLYRFVEKAQNILDSGNRSWFRNSRNRLLEPVIYSTPLCLDILSKWCITEQEFSPECLRRQTHISYPGHIYLFQMDDTPLFPIDETVRFNSDFNDSSAIMDVLNYLETLPYTDITCIYDETDDLKVEFAKNRYNNIVIEMLSPTLNKQNAESTMHSFKPLLQTWLRPIIFNASKFKIRIAKTWLEEVYIEISINDAPWSFRYYFDLVLWGLGSPAIFTNHPGFRQFNNL